MKRLTNKNINSLNLADHLFVRLFKYCLRNGRSHTISIISAEKRINVILLTAILFPYLMVMEILLSSSWNALLVTILLLTIPFAPFIYCAIHFNQVWINKIIQIGDKAKYQSPALIKIIFLLYGIPIAIAIFLVEVGKYSLR